MSASSKPTFLPCWARAIARLTLVVDFPTPPFPLLTITKFLICGARFLVLCGFWVCSWGLGCLISKLIFVIPCAFSFCVICVRSFSATSGEAEGISTRIETAFSWISISLTNPKVTISFSKLG